MHPIIGRLKDHTYLRNIAVLASGTALSQVLIFAATPVLTRLYDPAAFGVLGVFIAFVALVSLVAAWKYELAIVLPKDDESAANIFALSCLIVVFMTLLTTIIMALAGDWIAQRLVGAEYAFIFWWLSLAVGTGGLFNVFSYWATRRKYFWQLSASRISRSGGVAGVQILVGLAGAGAAGLIGGYVAGLSLATVVLGMHVYLKDRKLIYQTTNTNKIKEMALVHKKFPKYTVPQSMLNIVSQFLPVFLLTIFFDTTVGGLYWFTYRLLEMPSTVIGDAVARVFYQKAVESYHERGDILHTFKRTTLGLAAIAILPAAVILIFGPVLFNFIFGSAWDQAGVYAQWLIVSWFIGFITRPSVVLVPVFGIQHLHLSFEAATLIFRFCALYLGVFLGNDVTAIAIYAIIGAFLNIGLMAYLFNVLMRDRQLRQS